MAVWMLLQLPRLIAIPLIRDVLNGVESEAWMFPALLDVVVAAAAIPLAWLVWRKRDMRVWVFAILFFVVSILDHADAVTAGLLTPTPQVFGGENMPTSAALVPAAQAIGDAVFLMWLSTRAARRHYAGATVR